MKPARLFIKNRSSSDLEFEEQEMMIATNQQPIIGSDVTNFIGNAEEQQQHATLGLGMANLKLGSGKSSMRTRAAYKVGAIVNMGVMKTQECTQEELDQMERRA